MTTNRKEARVADTKKAGEERQSFATVLASIRPKTDIEAGEALTQLIEAVKTTGKAGRITIALEVKPADGSVEALLVNDKITVKIPEKSRASTIAFVGDGNRLQRTDPSAMPLFDDDIREPDVDLRTGEIKEPKP